MANGSFGFEVFNIELVAHWPIRQALRAPMVPSRSHRAHHHANFKSDRAATFLMLAIKHVIPRTRYCRCR